MALYVSWCEGLGNGLVESLHVLKHYFLLYLFLCFVTQISTFDENDLGGIELFLLEFVLVLNYWIYLYIYLAIFILPFGFICFKILVLVVKTKNVGIEGAYTCLAEQEYIPPRGMYIVI
ncbi:hypothetical protein RIF29_20839 [Crotalaria pallida]|uniref:Uncharacterized protein n=1 Tax=Crotalaria pallida TaxID=3830 RepID=A0AAN9F262_CROPI